MMFALVAGNIYLLNLLNKDWYNTLMFSIPGKSILAVFGVTIIVTALLMAKYTKLIEYKN